MKNLIIILCLLGVSCDQKLENTSVLNGSLKSKKLNNKNSKINQKSNKKDKFTPPKISSINDLENWLTSNIFYSDKDSYRQDGSVSGYKNFYKYKFYKNGSYQVWKSNDRENNKYKSFRTGKWNSSDDRESIDHSIYIKMYPDDRSILRRLTHNPRTPGTFYVDYSISDHFPTGFNEILVSKKEKKSLKDSWLGPGPHYKWMEKYGW